MVDEQSIHKVSSVAHLQAQAQLYAATHVKVNIVEFASSLFYCKEDEGSVQVRVNRLGTSSQPVTVQYVTRDGSAKAGEKFVGLKGSLSFAPGENSKMIEIILIGSDAFENDLEFEVQVFNPIGCVVGEYLQVCRVLIVDDDTYPSNKYEQQVRSHRIWSIRSWPLFFDFISTSMQRPAIKRACLKNMLTDQLMNMNYLLNVYLMNFLIDDLLQGSRQERSNMLTKLIFDQIPSLTGKATVLVAITLIPHLVMLVFKRMKAQRRIQGMVIDSMQCNITRKFLSYDETSRHMAAEADLLMTMTRDVTHLVHSGFVAVFEIMEKLGLLIILMITAFSQRGGMPVWTICFIFVAYPLTMVVFLFTRRKGIEQRRELADQTATDVVGYFQQLTACYRLIADYGQKPLAVATFDEHVGKANTAARNAHVYELVNLEFAPFLTTLFSGVFIIVQVHNAVADGASLGNFITGLAIQRTIGKCYESMYHDYLLMHDVMAPLRTIVHFMNLPSEAPHRMAVHRTLLVAADEEIKATRRKAELSGDKSLDHAYALDKLPFRLLDLTFSYPQFTGGTSVFRNADMEFPMGNLVAVTGPRGGGKATLLGLLGGVLIPPATDDPQPSVFVPAHLRVLHVSREPLAFADLTVFENLTFGPSDGDDEAEWRVLSICKRLGVSQQVITMIEENAMPLRAKPSPHKPRAVEKEDAKRDHDCDAHMAPMLSHTDMALLHLARAFVMNPEVLIIHKPLSHFDDLHSRLVIELLREFVDLRGIEKPIEDYATRRLRSCIISCESAKSTHNCVDRLYYVGNGKIALLHDEMILELKKASRDLFNSIDVNGDNSVGLQELIDAIKRKPWHGELLGLTQEQLSGPEDLLEHAIHAIFQRIDHSHNEDVDFDELVEYVRGRFQDDLPRVLEALRTYKEADQLLSGANAEAKAQDTEQLGSADIDIAGGDWGEPLVPKELPMLDFTRQFYS